MSVSAGASHEDFKCAVPAVSHGGNDDFGIGEDSSDAGDYGIGDLEHPEAPLESLGRNDDFHDADYSR